MRVHVGGVSGLGAGGNDEDAGDLVRRLVQRYTVFERIHDSFSRLETDRLVEYGMLETQVHQSDAATVPRGDTRDVPRRPRGPGQILRDRDQCDQRRAVEERWNQMTEPRERELAPRGSHDVSTNRSAAPLTVFPTSVRESGRADKTSLPCL